MQLSMLNYDLTILEKWSEDWLLQFNSNKTKALFFFKSIYNSTPQLFFFQACQLEFVSSRKHIDVLFSDDLKWFLHIDNIVNHAYEKLGLIRNSNLLCGETNY